MVDSNNSKSVCSKSIASLYLKLVVLIGGIFCLIVKGGKRRNKPQPPKPVLKKIHPDYPLTKDGFIKPGVITKLPTEQPTKQSTEQPTHQPTEQLTKQPLPSVSPTEEPSQPPPPPKPFLELNDQNPMSKDVSRLWHNEEIGAVCLTIPMNATCSHPFLIGRLSGPSLAILEWTATTDDHRVDDNDDSTTFCGNYDSGGGVIQGAVYYVEILTVYCTDFAVGALLPPAKTSSSSPSPRHTDEWLSFNWTEVCMQDTLTNRLTEENCAILTASNINNSSTTSSALQVESQLRNSTARIIQNDTQSQSLTRVPGYWIRNEKEYLIPLYSRFQPLDCQGTNKKLPRCAIPMDPARFESYDFSWSSERLEEWKSQHFPNRLQANNTAVLSKCSFNCRPNNKDCWDGMCRVKCVNCVQEKTMPTLPITEINRKKVCIVGASHSYHLMYSIDLLNMGHLFHWIELKFPVELQEGFFEEQYEKVGCKIFVIGFGQWPASHQSNPPYSFERYLIEMTRIAQLAQNTTASFQFYLRSMHHMPIGDRASACPPIDWRSPAVANGYNYLLEQAVVSATTTATTTKSPEKVHFLDTLFITRPMWDAAYDLYHLSKKVADLEALYIASKVLGAHEEG